MTRITNTDSIAVPAAAAVGRAGVSGAPNGTPAKSTVAATATVDASALAEAARQLNERYALRETNLHFFVDESTHETVVTVIDQNSGEVLRQIPSADALRIARELSDAPGGLIEHQA
jgi:flagellar protein FlaG